MSFHPTDGAPTQANMPDNAITASEQGVITTQNATGDAINTARSALDSKSSNCPDTGSDQGTAGSYERTNNESTTDPTDSPNTTSTPYSRIYEQNSRHFEFNNSHLNGGQTFH